MPRISPVVLLVMALVLTACSSGEPDPTPPASPTTEEQASSIAPTAAPTDEPRAAPIDPTPKPTSEAEDVPTPVEATAPVVAPSPTPAAARPSPTRTAEDSAFDEIAQDAARLRGLRIRSEIEEDYLSREQLRERLEKQIEEDLKPGDIEADERLLQIFGLAPEGLDLQELYVDLYSGQISGLYDPETESINVVSSGRKLNALGELTYAHEVTHALQDQHYDLEKLYDRAEKQNDDALLAVQSLVEGDASVLSYGDYLRANPELSSKIKDALAEEQAAAQLPPNVPPIIQETLVFPYDEGAIFVVTVRGGLGSDWDQVDAAYKDPPTSTEQILHPEEKYLQRDEPTAVKPPDLGPALGSGWKKLEENLFGEFQTRVLLEGELDSEDAEAAAAGWDGDGFALWSKGEQDLVAWQSVWDSTDDAEQFAAALREYDEARFDAQYEEQDGQYSLSTGEQVALIRQDGERVHYVLAPTEDLATKALATLVK